MKDVIKCALIFISGLIGGYAAGRYVSKCEYEEKLAKELYGMEKYYHEQHPEKPVREGGYTAPLGEIEIHAANEEYVKPKKVDYTSFYNTEDPAELESPPDDDPSVEDDDLIDIPGGPDPTGECVTEEYQKNKSLGVEMIDSSVFGDNPLYHPMHLVYYMGNDILMYVEDDTGEQDMIYFDEVEDYVGDALIRYKFLTDEYKQSHLYLRNYERGYDLEIQKVAGSYEG